MSAIKTLGNRLRQWADRANLGLTPPQEHRVHLDAAMAWLKRAQDATPDAGVAQTWLIRYQKWAPSYPETTGYIIPTFYRYAALAGDDDARRLARAMADWECEIQHPSGGVLAGALGDSDQPTIFTPGRCCSAGYGPLSRRATSATARLPCAPPPGCATSWMQTAAGASGVRP